MKSQSPFWRKPWFEMGFGIALATLGQYLFPDPCGPVRLFFLALLGSAVGSLIGGQILIWRLGRLKRLADTFRNSERRGE